MHGLLGPTDLLDASATSLPASRRHARGQLPSGAAQFTAAVLRLRATGPHRRRLGRRPARTAVPHARVAHRERAATTACSRYASRTHHAAVPALAHVVNLSGQSTT
ncbi:hypothetical protein ACWD3J_36035 [Streptomyces sp. NPDC002755]